MTTPVPDPRRRRRRATSAQGAPPEQAPPEQAPPAQLPPAEQSAPPETAAVAVPQQQRRRRPDRDAPRERGMRDLVGAGPSQLGVSGALRARDVNRPTDEDLARAERDVVIVRRSRQPDEHR